MAFLSPSISPIRFLFLVLGILWAIFASPLWSGAQTYPFTLDFEDGTLRGWTATGDAFKFQPTRGDNPTARKRGQPSKHQGNYWIGTYERYQGKPHQRPGDIQGDVPQGYLTSAPFTIPKGRLTFLVGGGSSEQTRVELLAGPSSDIEFMQQAHSSRGKNSETMERESWDLSAQAGKIGKIRIVDTSSDPWGHINVDDFRFEPPTPETTIVPDLFGQDLSAAQATLKGASLHLGRVTSRVSERPAGTVVGQRPLAKQAVPIYTEVHLELAEPEMVVVPGVVGQSLEEARALLARVPLRLGRVRQTPSSRPRGTILEQTPAPTTKVMAGSLVDLVVAAPPPPRTKVEVPSVKGRGLDEARELLRRARLRAGVPEKRASDARSGTVIGQNPGPGAWVEIDSEIALVVAIPPAPATVEVPDVTGLSVAGARQTIIGRGLTLGVVGKRLSDRETDSILEQSPKGGSQALPGDAVSLVVAAKGHAFPWGKFGSGLVAAGAAGVALLRLRRRSRSKAGGKGELEVIPKADTGFQEARIPLEKDAPGWEIVLRPMVDPGAQVLEVNGPLMAEKETGND